MTQATNEVGEELVSGHDASPGVASGAVRVVGADTPLDAIGDGDIIVAEMTEPRMVPAMKNAAGIVTDEGGVTSHAAIVSRELGIPAVVGCENATSVLESDRVVTIDGNRGVVIADSSGAISSDGAAKRESTADARQESSGRSGARTDPVTAAASAPSTATDVMVNVSLPEAAERAAATGADGVGLLRLEHILLSTGMTPNRYVEVNGEDAYVTELADAIRKVADEFYPRPVRVRTLDAPTDELRELEGGETEPRETNPMIGYRGVSRSFNEPEACKRELRAFKRLYDDGYDNLQVMFPLVNDADDVEHARGLMEDVGIDLDRRTWGAMIETPASALHADEIAKSGIDFTVLGTNDLVQFVLAVDRNNGMIADRFDEEHPAVATFLRRSVEQCREHGVATSIAGQAGSNPAVVRRLVEWGITSISANIDAVGDVRREIARTERRVHLDEIRD